MAPDLPVAVVVEHWTDETSCNGNEHTYHHFVFAEDFVDEVLDRVFCEGQASAANGWHVDTQVVWFVPDPTENLTRHEHLLRLVGRTA